MDATRFSRRGRLATLPFDQLAERYIRLSSLRTAANYNTALRSLRRFCGDKPLKFQHITPELLSDYERWLHANGVCRNTSSCYIRSLRSLYNKVCHAYGWAADSSPFQYTYTGVMRTRKRAIPERFIKRLMEVRLDRCPAQARSRDYFLFSIYACGMPFVDMAFLRKDQLRGDELTYYRYKTGQRVTIRIEQCMRDIIDRRITRRGVFVFPIITATTPERQYRQYRSQLTLYNRQLKALADKIRIRLPVTSYTARHTWATMAYLQHADINVIGQGLGHTKEQTTRIYINDMADERLSTVNRKILSGLHRK